MAQGHLHIMDQLTPVVVFKVALGGNYLCILQSNALANFNVGLAKAIEACQRSLPPFLLLSFKANR